MKLRLFTIFALTIGLALLVTWAVAAQGIKTASDIQLASVTAIDRVDLYSNHQDTVNLGYTSEITFTPAFTTYLPAVFKGYGVCSTAPTLLSPANGSSLNTLIPLFRWDNGNNPSTTGLRLQVAKDPNFTQSVWSLWSGGSPGIGEFRAPQNFDPATTYYWRAWLMCGEAQGPYSEIWSFTTGSDGTILPAPALIAPANGSTLSSLPATLQWSAVSGAEGYVVRWREAGTGGFSYLWVTETQTSISWLSANTTYEWWVSAWNDYAVGADSASWQFTTPAQISSLSPENLNHSIIVVEDGITSIFECYR